MELRKIIVRLFILLGISCLFYILIMFALMKINRQSGPLMYAVSDVIVRKGGNTFKKFRDFNTDKKYGVIVMGSSHAYRGYDPRIFLRNGIQLFNLGTSSQSMVNTYFIATDCIKPAQCKLIILDVYDEALCSDGVESTADLMQNVPFAFTPLKMGLALKDPRIINMLTVRLLSCNDPPAYEDPSYKLNGYCEKVDSIKTFAGQKYISSKEMNPLQVNYFEKLLAYFTRNKIKTVLVTHPSPKECRPGIHFKIRETVSAIALKYNIEYLDYYDDQGFDTKYHFFDLLHLNQAGVEKFNELLINDLERKEYAKWLKQDMH